MKSHHYLRGIDGDKYHQKRLTKVYSKSDKLYLVYFVIPFKSKNNKPQPRLLSSD